MQELKSALAHEQGPINEAMARHISELPLAARPVAEHVFAAGGKRLRPFLTVLTGRAFGCSSSALYSLGAAVEMLHAATLLHDDILDNADLRRGKAAAHTVFAPSKVILAGDALLAKALLTVSSFGDTRLTDIISLAVMRTAEGEIAEFDKLRDPDVSFADYLAMVTGKTAWMLRASCELGALFAGASDEQVGSAAVFGLELGIAFQMVDDAIDVSPAELTGKPSGGDIKEGKMTPPLRMYLDSLDGESSIALKERFTSGAMTDEEVAAISEGICRGGFADRTREMAEERLGKAALALQAFPESEERIVLRQMLNYVGVREK